MPNQLTQDTALLGDVLLATSKLDKAFKIRIGAGGVAVGTSATVLSSNPLGTLPAQALVYDCFINVLTASASQTISVGTTATPTGFVNGLSVGTTGLVRPRTTSATSGGNTGGFMLVSNTYGSLLSTFSSGSTSAGDSGFFTQRTYPTDSVASLVLSVTPSSSAFGPVNTFSADVYIFYTDVTR